MVCDRCKSAVHTIFTAIGLPPGDVRLGEVTISKEPDQEQLTKLSQALENAGFALILEKGSRLVEQVKNAVVEMIHYSPPSPIKYSVYIANRIGQDYTLISKLFSEHAGISIEQYIIRQRIESVKEFLGYGELSLTQIADRLGYSSVAHLSAQFKKITGFTPRAFKKALGPAPLGNVTLERITLDRI